MPLGGSREGELADSELLRGLGRGELNADLLKLLGAVTEVAESGSPNMASYKSAGQVFDALWRRLGLSALDTLLIRWRAAEAARRAFAQEKPDPARPDDGLGPGDTA